MSVATSLLAQANTRLIIRVKLRFAIPKEGHRVEILIFTEARGLFVKVAYKYVGLPGCATISLSTKLNDYATRQEFAYEVSQWLGQTSWYSEDPVVVALQQEPKSKRETILPPSDLFSLQHLCRLQTLLQINCQSRSGPDNRALDVGQRLSAFIREQNHAWATVTGIPVP